VASLGRGRSLALGMKSHGRADWQSGTESVPASKHHFSVDTGEQEHLPSSYTTTVQRNRRPYEISPRFGAIERGLKR